MKAAINPMYLKPAFPNAPQCTATSKRTGRRCRAPAVNGWKVCRFHGARGGAPSGSANGGYVHGLRTMEAMADRARLRDLLREAHKLISTL